MNVRQAIDDGVIVLDGGLATELERRGHDLSGDLWSAQLLRDDPDEIVEAHRAFFAAGAMVATTASYQASFAGFAALGMDHEEAAMLMRRSVELAIIARDEHGSGWVAASVGPYGAVLADGSEYTGDYGLSVAELREFHRPRLDVLAASGADVLAVETIPCAAEVEALVAELDDIGMPAWLSLTCAGRTTRAGEPAAEVFAMAASSDAIVAVGVNCTAPADLDALIPMAAATGRPVVAYPNSGEVWDGAHRCWTGEKAFHPDDVRRWVRAGVRLIGGCCRVGPAEIRAITSATTSEG